MMVGVQQDLWREIGQEKDIQRGKGYYQESQVSLLEEHFRQKEQQLQRLWAGKLVMPFHTKHLRVFTSIPWEVIINVSIWLSYIIYLYIHMYYAKLFSHYCRLFVTPWTAACQAPLSFTISQSSLKFMFIELVMLSNHLILCHLLLWLQSFPALGSFPWVGSSHQAAKVLELQLQYQSF